MARSASLIDLAALPDDVRWRIEDALSRAMSDHSHDAWMRQICAEGTDAEVIAAGEKEYRDAPIGLSTWYPTVWRLQETCFSRVAHNGQRRPVFMRGAVGVLIRRYCLTEGGESPNGWAARVFWRAVRMAKITALDKAEFRDATAPIRDALCHRYNLTAPFDRNTGWDIWGGPDLIGGNRSYLREDQRIHIKALHNIAKRSESLERKRELVRHQLRERLSA